MAKTEQQDLARVFPLLKDLFAYTEEHGINQDGFRIYSGELEDDGEAVALPENFFPLVSDYPADYFIVAYENRNDSYYKAGTRGRLVRLSTVPKRSETEERVREIDLNEMDPSYGNRIQITVRESIKNKSYELLNTAQGAEIEQPHGEAKLVYEIDQAGGKTPIESVYRRLDEGLFPWHGEDKPVRWNRSLRLAKDSSGVGVITYEDAYIIGRWEKSKGDERAEIKTTVHGSIEKPDAILVEIGHGSLSSAETLYEDNENNIKIVLHSKINEHDNPLEILEYDPIISSLLKHSLDPQIIKDNLRLKIHMMQTGWDSPQAIFAEKQALKDSPKELNPSSNR